MLAAAAFVLWRSDRVQSSLQQHRLGPFLHAYQLRGVTGQSDMTRGVKHLTYASDDGLVFEVRLRGRRLLESWVMAQGEGWTKNFSSTLKVFGDHYAAVAGLASNSASVNNYRTWLRPYLQKRRTRLLTFKQYKVDLQFAPAFIIQDVQ